MPIFVACLLALPAAAQVRTLRVVSDNNYPPYLFLGPDGEPRGYVVDEWKLWERKTGIKVELTATNWADAQWRLLHGQADVIDMMFKTPARAGLYDFSAPYATVNVGIYADTGLNGITDPSSLEGFNVGVERGDACVERLHADGILSLHLFTGYADLIKAADRQQIKIFCMDESPAEYYLYRMGHQREFKKAFDYYTNEFRRGVLKGNTATLALVARGMALITDDERAALHRKWFGLPLQFAPYVQWIAYAVAALLALGIGLLLWIYSLRRSVERRTRDLEFLGRHDALTSLPNRRLLLERMDHAISQHDDARMALLLVKLDGVNRINESLGHPVGDQLLQSVTRRLLDSTPDADTVARLTDDEFAVVLNGHADTTRISATASRIIHRCAEAFALNGNEVFVAANVGICCYPHDGAEGVLLLKHAAVALHKAAQAGRNTFDFYSTELTEKANHLLQLGVSLRRALKHNEFALAYQPQVDLATGTIIGVEALIRWHTPQGNVPPSQFIPFAEEAGLIEPMGRWVLNTACQQLATWLQAGLPPIRMAVNLSPRQVASAGLVDQVQAALHESGIPPQLLELEITESALMEPGTAAVQTLNELRALGVKIAIDDFGIGYSSLSYLRHLPVDLLKIDQSFMRGVPEEPGAAKITSAIVAMGKTLHLRVLAEGVENAAQWAFLRNIGCDYAQGWHLAKAMYAEDLEPILRVGALWSAGSIARDVH